jgi:hypothetical protein
LGFAVNLEGRLFPGCENLRAMKHAGPKRVRIGRGKRRSVSLSAPNSRGRRHRPGPRHPRVRRAPPAVRG